VATNYIISVRLPGVGQRWLEIDPADKVADWKQKITTGLRGSARVFSGYPDAMRAKDWLESFVRSPVGQSYISIELAEEPAEVGHATA